MKRLQEGLVDMDEVKRQNATPEHDVIYDAIREPAEGYTLFSIVSVAVITANDPIASFILSQSSYHQLNFQLDFHLHRLLFHNRIHDVL